MFKGFNDIRLKPTISFEVREVVGFLLFGNRQTIKIRNKRITLFLKNN